MRWGVFIFSLVLFAPGEVLASACSVAKARLAQLEKAPSARYAAAMRSQRAQMTKTRAMMGRHGCPGSRSAQCRTLGRAYGQMQRNMRKLKRGGRSSASRRRALLRVRRACREFKRNRTRIQQALGTRPRTASQRARSSAPKRARVRQRTDRLRVKRGAAPRANASPSASAPVPTSQSQITFRARFARGTYRTMCVRTCDGFAFPASLATPPSRFHEDAARCPAMCPGRELRLFATKARSAGVAKARDVETGQPYETLPFAFRHRERYDAACRCDFKRVAVEDGRLAGGPIVAQHTRVPTWRPAFPPVEVAAPAEPVQAPPQPRTQNGVRIVGQTYFAD